MKGDEKARGVDDASWYLGTQEGDGVKNGVVVPAYES